MSTQTLALGLLSLVVAPIFLPASAVARPSGRSVEIQQFCKELVAEGGTPSMSLGECIALNNSTSREKHNWWVHVCHNWRDEGLLDNHYSSYAECVQDYETY
jgi:hypothetical protein